MHHPLARTMNERPEVITPRDRAHGGGRRRRRARGQGLTEYSLVVALVAVIVVVALLVVGGQAASIFRAACRGMSNSVRSCYGGHPNGFTEFPLASGDTEPSAATLGPDGNVWFNEYKGVAGALCGGSTSRTAQVVRVTPAGVITEFPESIANGGANAITVGSDGNLWSADYGFYFAGNACNTLGLTQVTTAGVQANFTGFYAGQGATLHITGVTSGPDRNIWLNEYNLTASDGKVAFATTAGAITEVTTLVGLPAGGTVTLPSRNLIVAGPDGNLWYTANDRGSPTQHGYLVKVVPNGVSSTQTAYATTMRDPGGITVGPDGNLWYASNSSSQTIGRMDTGGNVIGEYATPTVAANYRIRDLTIGPDGNLWAAEMDANKLLQVVVAGSGTPVMTEYAVPTTGATPTGITIGQDGNLWFTEESIAVTTPKVGRLNFTG